MGRYWKNTPGGPVWNSNTTLVVEDLNATSISLAASGGDYSVDGAVALMIQPDGASNQRTYIAPDNDAGSPVASDIGLQVWDSLARPHMQTLFLDPFNPPTIQIGSTTAAANNVSILTFYPAAKGPSYWESAPAGPVWNGNTTIVKHVMSGTPDTLSEGGDVDITGCVAATVHVIGGETTDLYVSTDSGDATSGLRIKDSQGQPWEVTLYMEPSDLPTVYMHSANLSEHSVLLFRP
jgi:hypothetical protein